MKICIVVEGAYPYVQGGVSSWVHTLASQLPEYEFVIQTIIASHDDSGKFKYKLPDNVTDLRESFLEDDDIYSRRNLKLELTPREREAMKTLIFGENEQWEVIFDMFKHNSVSVNRLLMGNDFYDLVWEYYQERYNRVTYTDFVWTCRSMFLPIFLILKNKILKADLYHTISTGYAGLVAAYAGYANKKPVMLTEHGIYTREREEEIIRAGWTHGIYKDLWIEHFRTMSRCIYNFADNVISLFEDARQLQIEYGCGPEKTQVIRNGIKYDAFQRIPRKDPNDDHINICAVVRVTPIKDIKTMINAFHFAREKNPLLRLYIIGPTDEDEQYYSECLEVIKMLGAEGITFTGYVNLREWFGKMDMFLLTSISEGQPISLLEAMAASIPIITTDVGNCREMIKADDADNCAGISVSVMNVGQITAAILQLAEDPGMRRFMGANANRIADRLYRESDFIDAYRRKYLDVYNNHMTKIMDSFDFREFGTQSNRSASPTNLPISAAAILDSL